MMGFELRWYDVVTLACVGVLLAPWGMCGVVCIWQFVCNYDS